MEDMELEEGEAYTYNRNRKYDECMDPDVALSYIDEKLQNVLGHFQKDFEGGVFTENLGAKYGGYGSFLPTYQRSPTWSHLQSSTLQNHDMDSPSTSQLEDACYSSVASLATSRTTRCRRNSSCAMSPPSQKDRHGNNPLKEGGHVLVEDVNRHEPMNRKNEKFLDNKMPKLKIKMGSDNPAIKKKVEIYSGLGLDVSPSSSLEDSHSESEDVSPRVKDIAYESPTSIIQMMTSLPPFLSPLPDYLIHLTKREGHSGSAPASRAFVKDQRKKSEKKKLAAAKKTDASGELWGNENQRYQDINVPSKKEPRDHLNFEEHVSKTAMLSNPSSTANDTSKSKGKASSGYSKDNKIPSRDIIFSDEVKEDCSEVEFTEEVGCIEKPKMCSNKTLSEADKETIDDDPPGNSRKDGRSWKDNTVASESKLNAHKQRSISIVNQPHIVDPPWCNDKKVSSQEKDVLALRPRKMHSSSKGRGKLKETESDKSGSSLVSKSGKSIHKITPISRGGIDDLESSRNSGRDRDRYREFFGEMEQEDEMKSESMEMSSQIRQKESEESSKGKSALTDIREERSGGRKSKKDSALDIHLSANSDFGTGSENNPTLDVVPSAVAPVIIDEHWVGCDKCEKWRLLPPGKNPNDLPEKWQCRMLDWLPGKNKCNVSQEETTNAVMAMFQAPVPYVQNEMHNAGISASTLTTIHHSVEGSMHAQSPGVKKKNGVKKASYGTSSDGRPSSSHSSKKNAQASKSKNLNDVKQFHPEIEADIQQNSLSGELSRRKDSNYQNVLEHHSEGAGKTQKSNDHASVNYDRRNKYSISVKERSERVEIATSGTMGARKINEREVAAKKRKSKEPLSDLGHQFLDDGASMNEHRKEKKAKNSEGKHDIANKGNRKSDRRSSDGKRQSMENNMRKSQEGPNGIAPMAATSSSSKICGSHKSKASYQEMRGSPAESVSSSPIRSSKTNKHSSLRQTAKDDFHGASIFAADYSNDRATIVQPQTGRDDESFSPTHPGSPKSVVFNCDRDHFSGRNSTTPDIIDSHFPKDSGDYSGKDVPYPGKLQQLEERKIERNTRVNGLDSGKGAKHSSSQSKNKRRRSKHEGEINAKDFPDSFNGLEQSSPSKKAQVRDSNVEIHESGLHHARKNDSYKSRSNIKRKNDRDLGEHENVVEHTMFDKDAKDIQNHAVEKYPQQASKVPARGKAKQSSGPYKAEMLNSHKDKEVCTFEVDDKRKMKINMKNDECPSGTKHQNLRPLASSGTSNHDVGTSGPHKKESLSQAATSAIKEAKALKHLADRVKTSGSNQERTGLYFQAALKFLHGASLLELSSCHSTRHGEMIQSVQMYGSTAKLCTFCAHEYEKSKDMASAALAYKCTEVAYMKVVYSSNSTVCRDRSELQATLKMISPGESPPSTASDVINVNNPAAAEKNSLPKGGSSPQNGGNHGVDAPNRSNIAKLLSFAQDVDNAMVASRKARSAFVAASSKSGEAQSKEVISSIKKALDFNFHDVEELLRLVRLAMETINRG